MSSTDVEPDEAGSKPITLEETAKAHRAFSLLTRELSDAELDSPGARKLLLEWLAQAEDELGTLRSVRDKFHEADKARAVLVEKLNVRAANKAISMGCLAVGAAAIGYAPGFWSAPSTSHPSAGSMVLGFGIVLTGAAILAEVIRK